jgi:cell wall-associated NlpC family hydrolase
MLKTSVILLITLVMLISGCAGPDNAKHKNYSIADIIEEASRLSPKEIKQALYEQFKEWKSVKYKYGGLSKKGIDCSGFVYITYRSKFGIKLPRSTKLQLKSGQRITKSKLRPGDLVIFKTGLLARHVGLYIGERQFLHASTSKGVTISRLDDNYWTRKYWKSIRIKI